MKRTVRNKGEKLEKVIQIMNELRSLKLLNTGHDAISELHDIMTDYLDSTHSMNGFINFEEIDRVIEYQLPIQLNEQVIVKLNKK
jgi:flagellin-specific chaperone FliS